MRKIKRKFQNSLVFRSTPTLTSGLFLPMVSIITSLSSEVNYLILGFMFSLYFGLSFSLYLILDEGTLR